MIYGIASLLTFYIAPGPRYIHVNGPRPQRTPIVRNTPLPFSFFLSSIPELSFGDHNFRHTELSFFHKQFVRLQITKRIDSQILFFSPCIFFRWMCHVERTIKIKQLSVNSGMFILFTLVTLVIATSIVFNLTAVTLNLFLSSCIKFLASYAQRWCQFRKRT